MFGIIFLGMKPLKHLIDFDRNLGVEMLNRCVFCQNLEKILKLSLWEIKRFSHSNGLVMVQRTGCCGYRNLFLYLVVNTSLGVVCNVKLMRDYFSPPLEIDKSKRFRKILISSLSSSIICVQLVELSYSSVICNTFIFWTKFVQRKFYIPTFMKTFNFLPYK